MRTLVNKSASSLLFPKTYTPTFNQKLIILTILFHVYSVAKNYKFLQHDLFELGRTVSQTVNHADLHRAA